jgi:hypothetical protein
MDRLEPKTALGPAVDEDGWERTWPAAMTRAIDFFALEWGVGSAGLTPRARKRGASVHLDRDGAEIWSGNGTPNRWPPLRDRHRCRCVFSRPSRVC